ncbi:hypothetical protein [Donghicola tyrosinivorans]|uniref:hypothetical protein n=1 Tax=Donghicola tyrosinivorans TaxID=1652492 RepID=UPI0011B2429E|nr:hypothetical protein [Donghicola tyrosinivorans]
MSGFVIDELPVTVIEVQRFEVNVFCDALKCAVNVLKEGERKRLVACEVVLKRPNTASKAVEHSEAFEGLGRVALASHPFCSNDADCDDHADAAGEKKPECIDNDT